MDKKAQGLSLNTIIIGLIVLVVLVIIIAVATGYFGKIFAPTVNSCSSAGGMCNASCGGLDDYGGQRTELTAYKDSCGTQKCCSKGILNVAP